MEPVLNVSQDTLSEVDANLLARLFASDGSRILQRIVRSKLASATARIGLASVQEKLGVEGQKSEAETNLELAVKYTHWLEVFDELRSDKNLVDITRNV